MRLAPEGRPFIIGTGILALVAWGAVLLAGGSHRWPLVLAGLLTVLTAFVTWFFRDPRRTAPSDDRWVLSPADGKVLDITETVEDTFFRGACRRVTIFLSVFNVHVQKAPTAGVVTHRSYRPGAFAVAWKPKASEDNEQASLGFVTPHGPLLVRQIAGLVARRIVTDPNEGDRVRRGDRIGLIRFGSRVDLFLPLDWPVECAVGDVVRGGSTSVARLPEEAA
jgi:phosphatidylserine decarboxylase